MTFHINRKGVIIPAHNIERQTEGSKYHESLVETNVRANFDDLWYMVQVGEGKETLVPERRSYTDMSSGKYPTSRAHTKYSRNDVDGYDHKNTFNGS